MSMDTLIRATLSSEPAVGGAVGKPVQSHQRLLSHRPHASLAADGTLSVVVQTLHAVPAVIGYYGTVMPDDALAVTRYRKQSSEVLSNTSRTWHEVKIPVPGLLRETYDVHHTRIHGRGLVAWRVDVQDPGGGSRIFDGATAYRCTPIPCGPDAQFIQLASFGMTPRVDLVSASDATVSFTTDVETAAVVLVQSEAGELLRAASSQASTRHEIQLSKLAPSTRYRYQVLIVDARGEVTRGRSATFRTAPADQDSQVTFVALSDSRSGIGSAEEHYVGSNMNVLRGLLQSALNHSPDFVVFAGDLVDGYTTEPEAFRFELEAWQHAIAPVAAYVPIYEVFGNHESLVEAWESGFAIGRRGADSAEAVFAEIVTNPRNGPQAKQDAPPYAENVYSFDVGPVHVAAINSNYYWRSHPQRKDHPAFPRGQREGWVNDEIIDWLDQDLTAATGRGAKHLVVTTHEPGFPNGGHTQDAMYWSGKVPEVLVQRDKLFRLLGKHSVSAFISGDEHNYSRTRIDQAVVPNMPAPVWQFVSGGAGAPYYARQSGLPWAAQVEAFDVRQHFIVFEVDGARASATAYALSGEVIDQVDLSRP